MPLFIFNYEYRTPNLVCNAIAMHSMNTLAVLKVNVMISGGLESRATSVSVSIYFVL